MASTDDKKNHMRTCTTEDPTIEATNEDRSGEPLQHHLGQEEDHSNNKDAQHQASDDDAVQREKQAEEEEEEEEERMALGRITNAMMQYAFIASFETNRWKRNLDKLSERHASLLSRGTIYGNEGEQALITEAIHQNDMFLRYMVHWLVEEGGPPPLHAAFDAADAWRASKGEAVMPADFEKVLYVLKNVARDWSKEFEAERDESYGVLCDVLETLFKDTLGKASPKVLVPGCGLGRLCVDLVARGFDVVGNEHSYFMLMTSAYILNGLARQGQWTIHPWVLQSSNVLSLQDQLQSISIPDALPLHLVSESSGSLGMVAGDFVQVFKSEEFHLEYDAVVTCFFLDTAQNVIEYMEIIWDVLRPGGVWVHLGPLQWHWADSHTYLDKEDVSIEVPLDTVMEIARHVGFEFEHIKGQESRVAADATSFDGKMGDDGDMKPCSFLSCSYMSNPTSMRPQTYTCALWVARKPHQVAVE